MENKSHAFAAGLFVLLLGAALLSALYWLNGDREATRDYIVVTKQNIGGLNPQAQVRYRGIRVGKVSDIRLDPQDRSNILVTIAVRADLPLSRGTVAKLSYQGVTGLAHILLLETGNGDDPLLPEGGVPPRIAMIPSLIDELGETGTATLVQAQQLMASANAMLTPDNARRLAATLANLEAASAGLKPVLGHLDTTLVQVNKLLDDRNVGRLSQAAADVGPLLGDARLLLTRMQATSERIDLAVGDAAGGGAAALVPRLNDMAADFSQTSHQLSRLLRILEESPQGLVFGVPAVPPGPGEAGFAPDKEK
ncbi:MAG: MlaD family protein [Dechloromonas sp.]|nr:MlaD family protein [Dechloromonas sp.]